MRITGSAGLSCPHETSWDVRFESSAAFEWGTPTKRLRHGNSTPLEPHYRPASAGWPLGERFIDWPGRPPTATDTRYGAPAPSELHAHEPQVNRVFCSAA